MTGRWSVLALLFGVRATMGFQYQSVAAIAPLVTRDFGVDLADVGLLIGLYLAPGVAIALPGGALGGRFTDKRVALAGLALMIAGGLVMVLLPGWSAQVAGRVIAGFGGVLLNVIMSKMVTDWFAGREIASAMAIFVNSWPVGIAFALIALPSAGSQFGVAAVHLIAAAVVAIGFGALSMLYRAPQLAAGTQARAFPAGRALAAVLLAGLIWALFNVAVLMIFGFGPAMLTERGWSVAAAGSAVSAVMWVTMLSVPAGGFLSDWIGRPIALIASGSLVLAAALIVGARSDAVLAIFVVLGLAVGLPAGAIMSLPARVLEPATRAAGMGLFFTVFYACMFAAPAFVGWLAARTGSVGVAFDFGAAVLVIAAGLTAIFPLVAKSSTGNAMLAPRNKL